MEYSTFLPVDLDRCGDCCALVLVGILLSAHQVNDQAKMTTGRRSLASIGSVRKILNSFMKYGLVNVAILQHRVYLHLSYFDTLMDKNPCKKIWSAEGNDYDSILTRP